MQDYEKLGVFYLGKRYEIDENRLTEDLILYDSRDLTTHAFCVGMTGSGKTGLCVAILEEAAIDGVPAIVIDPKGDMANLALAFPNLRSGDFAPWVSAHEAESRGMPLEAYAKEQAELWKKGLASWGQPPERLFRFRAAAEVTVYTPGSAAGHAVSVLRSFRTPSSDQLMSLRSIYRIPLSL